MNLRAVLWLLGCVLLLLAGFMLVPAAVGLWYREFATAWACLGSAFLTALCGFGAVLGNRRATKREDGRADFFRREGLAVVGLSWLLVAIFGALPFVLAGAIASPIDAFFESASGFTTTGSSILSAERIDALPRALSFWRSFSHWLGGIGIVMVFVALHPSGGRSLFRSEVAGVVREASQHRVRDSAISLFRVYLILTVAGYALLLLCGLTPFDALLHSFSSVATGGFSNHGSSVAWFDSLAVELVISTFSLLAAVNFVLYDGAIRHGLRRGWRDFWGSSEVRVFFGLVGLSMLVVALGLWLWGGSRGLQGDPRPDYRSFLACLRDATFSVASIHTSTGFATADFDQWPHFCRLWLMFVMFVGGCAGSTAGGLKVVRFVVVAKGALRSMLRFARPRAIHSLRFEGESLDDMAVASITGYFGLLVLVVISGTLVLAGLGVEPVAALTGVLATISNCGPGLGEVGPAGNFGGLPEAAKLLLGLFMILGRLEFYALVVLLVPGFWRR